MNLSQMIAGRDAAGIAAFINEHNLAIKNGKIVAKDASARKAIKAKEEFWGSRQLARKILLKH